MIGEIDAGQGFGDVELAGNPLGVGAVPIEDTIGCIGILLDFMDEKSRTDGVYASGFDEDGLAFFWSDGVDLIGDCALRDGLLEAFASDSMFQPDVKFRAWLAVSNEPHFGFRLAVERCGDGCGRVDLDGEVSRAIENFDEYGETLGVG